MANDGFSTFVQGAQLQTSILNSSIARERQRQQIEQEQSKFPLELQQIELQNKAYMAQIASRGFENQMKSDELDDQVTFKSDQMALAKGEKPTGIYKTQAGALNFQKFQSGSDIEKASIQTRINFATRANKLRGDRRAQVEGLGRKLLNELGNPSGEAWLALGFQEQEQAKEELATKAEQDKLVDTNRTDQNLREIKARGDERFRVALAELQKKASDPTSGFDKLVQREAINAMAIVRRDHYDGRLTTEQAEERLSGIRERLYGLVPGPKGAAAGAAPVPADGPARFSLVNGKWVKSAPATATATPGAPAVPSAPPPVPAAPAVDPVDQPGEVTIEPHPISSTTTPTPEDLQQLQPLLKRHLPNFAGLPQNKIVPELQQAVADNIKSAELTAGSFVGKGGYNNAIAPGFNGDFLKKTVSSRAGGTKVVYRSLAEQHQLMQSKIALDRKLGAKAKAINDALADKDLLEELISK